MAVDLDIVGSAGVDVVPVAPRFHVKLEAMVLPSADRVGEQAGRRLGDALADAMMRQVAPALPQAVTAGGQAATRAAARQGDDAGGAFARSLKTKLTVAFRSLPKMNVGLDDTSVDAQLARLRARMETLAGKRIGIDVSTAAAEAEVARIQGELERLGAQHPEVSVRADTATARAALAELRAEIAAVDAADPEVDVKVDVTGARAALLSLGLQMAVLMAIPLGPVLAAGLGSVVSMATAAGVGIGAFALAAIPAVKGVTEVMAAQKAAQDEATNAVERGAATASAAASRALQLAGAQASLASAHRNAERTIVQSNRAIEDAERNLAQAGMRAADQRRQAAENVERAERSLSDAKQAALRAERDLTQAREEAAKQLDDLKTRLEDSSLDERGAVLRVKEAQEELARVTADPKATALQRERAKLAADEAVRNLQRQRDEIADLKAEVDKQSKAGVDGSEKVVTAQERLADAQRKVGDEAKALADAQRAAARTQLQIQSDLADAQRRVADAVENSANAQIAAAEAIASAERGVASARLSGASATSTAITRAQEYERALAKLTPAQRELYDSIAGPQGIKSAFKDWATALQPHVLPIFTRAVDGAKASLPGLTPLVISASNGIQTLMDRASAELKTPFWVEFKRDLKESVEPAVVGFGTAFGNVIKGIAGIIGAFLPKMDGIASRSESITERFARWGTSLKGSPAFEKFLDNVKENAPIVAGLIGGVLSALFDTTQALTPVSSALMVVVTPLFDAVSWLMTNVPELVIALLAVAAAQKVITLGMAAWGAAMGVYSAVTFLATVATQGWAFALAGTGIVPIIRAIVLVVGLLVAAVIYAYKNWDWFRVTVDTVASAIGTAASWLWETILKPVFEGIWWLLQKVGKIAVWLWDVAIGPTFRFLWEAGKILFTILVVGVLTPIYLAIKALGAIGMWLWEEIFRPIFTWIGDKAKKLYDDYIKPYLGEAKKTFEALGTAFKWVWDNILRPVFTWLGDKAKKTWDEDLKPAFDLIGKGVDKVAESFSEGKDSIKKAWDQLQEIAKKPVRFIIDKVYNGGIVPMWNKVAEFTGVDKLTPMDLRGFARGGVLPGYSTYRQGDDQLVPMRRGEGVYVSEAMRDPYERARLFAVNKAAMNGQSLTQYQGGYAEGGIVGWLKDKASDISDLLSNPLDVFSGVKRIITDQMKGILTNPWARQVAKMPGAMLDGLKNKALGLLGLDSAGNAVGGGPWVKPVDGAFGTPFGKAGSMWSSGRHTGLDFPAAIGTAIKAVAGGRVSSTGSTGPYGIHLTVDHGGGLTSLYAHLSQLLTAAGAPVSAGQVIGRVGDTGNVTGPHLHLEARRNGSPIDPMPFFTSGGGGGGAGVERWRSTVLQALRITGNPASYADLTLRRMNQESGGNPNAVNNWDINAKNGMPSVGLMQVIRPTFDAYAGHMRNVGPKLHGVSTNPLANIFASMNYAKDRYGSLPTAYNRPGGYATGGFPAMGELAWVGEHGPELVRFLHPAQVYSHGESMAMAREATTVRGGITQAPNIIVESRTFLGDRELTDIVRTEIDIRDANTARELTTGVRI
ncbi:peptidoglycan DD-metalloendopeptidase family protein [Streptomyces cinereoruber]|uniref:peptidoglycan DD-metalloendopeptidase family protein n=1 Tax=Streptomyces cinereoruber TaxID=67260 RepID=UPI0036399244